MGQWFINLLGIVLGQAQPKGKVHGSHFCPVKPCNKYKGASAKTTNALKERNIPQQRAQDTLDTLYDEFEERCKVYHKSRETRMLPFAAHPLVRTLLSSQAALTPV